VTVLDASALIAFLDPTDALHGTAIARLKALDPEHLGVSPVTHAEVLVGPTRAGTLAATQRALTVLGIAEIALPADAAPRLAALRVDTRLKLPECCVLLAAQQRAETIMTFDDRLASAARKLAVGVEEQDRRRHLAS